MKFSHLFRPKWRHPDANVRLAAMSSIRDPNVLYDIATQSPDERLRLEAAHRLNDPTLLIRLARGAADAEIRFEAALLVRDETTLAAIALDEWHIEHGKLAVIHIDNALLLRRIVRSASQQLIRLSAALKLADPTLLRQLALSANNMDICWQVAQYLDDPYLLATVASTKPSNERLANLSLKAHHAFLDHLDRCRNQLDIAGLSTIITTIPHPLLKIDAFLRLPPDKITPELVAHLSQQNYQSNSNRAIRHLFDKIQQTGWQVKQSIRPMVCRQCNGEGQFSLRSMAVESSRMAHDLSTCSGCDGLGQQLINTVTCHHPKYREVIFHLPAWHGSQLQP